MDAEEVIDIIIIAIVIITLAWLFSSIPEIPVAFAPPQ